MTCGEGEDLEGGELSHNYDEAGEGELDHGAPAAKGERSEAAPALAALDEEDVEREEKREEVHSEDDGDRGADEAPAEFLSGEDVILVCWLIFSLRLLLSDCCNREGRWREKFLPKQKASS